MKVKMLTSIASVSRPLKKGSEYDVDDAEGQRMVDAGQATVAEFAPLQRQTMDKPKGTPVENIGLRTGDAGKQQTAASVEAAATAAKAPPQDANVTGAEGVSIAKRPAAPVHKPK